MRPQEIDAILAAEPIFRGTRTIISNWIEYGGFVIFYQNYFIAYNDIVFKPAIGAFELKVILFTILPKSCLDVQHVRNFIVAIIRNKGFQVNIITEQNLSGDMEIEIAHAAGSLRYILCSKYMYSGDTRIKYKKIDAAESHLKLCGALDPNTEFGQQMLKMQASIEYYRTTYPATAKIHPLHCIQNTLYMDMADNPDLEVYAKDEPTLAIIVSLQKKYKKIKRAIKVMLPLPIAEEVIPQINWTDDTTL